DSTVGGVKAALNRGRSKLESLPQPSKQPRAANPELSRLLHLYVERFNRQDWDGLRELISADARLQVADRYVGALANAPHFGVYARWKTPLHMAVGEVDGEPVVIIHDWDGSGWSPTSLLHLEVTNDRIVRIADYIHCPWILTAAASVVTGEIS